MRSSEYDGSFYGIFGGEGERPTPNGHQGLVSLGFPKLLRSEAQLLVFLSRRGSQTVTSGRSVVVLIIGLDSAAAAHTCAGVPPSFLPYLLHSRPLEAKRNLSCFQLSGFLRDDADVQTIRLVGCASNSC